jgi:hypothetical protein
MSSVQNLWRQLVQRRLWPVAVLLLAGLAVVPVMLAKDPEPVAATPPAPAKTGDNELAEQPIVTPAADTRGRRIVIGKRKNPFAMPKPDDPTETTDQPSASVVRTAGGGDSAKPSSSGGGGGSSTPSSGSSPAPAPAPAPVDPTPAPQPKTYAVHELTVRFGTSDDLSRRTLKRLQPLPSAAQPVLIYMGVLKDGKTAVFLVDHGVEPVGDGECMPRPDDCETIRLRAGETEFLDVKDETGAVTEQYQLDLLKIHKGTTASAAKASASSRSGARIVRARAAHDGPAGYRFDAARGTLERRGHALRSSVAHLSSGLG